MKRKIDKIILVVLASIIFGYGLFSICAIQYDTDKAIANYGVVNYQFQLHNEVEQRDEWNVGDTVRADVRVENTGSGSLCVRIKAIFANSAAEEACEMNVSNSFEEGFEDTYFYYPVMLEPGEMTDNLFSYVKIKDDAVLEDGFTPEMIIYAEAISLSDYANPVYAWLAYDGYSSCTGSASGHNHTTWNEDTVECISCEKITENRDYVGKTNYKFLAAE